MTAPAAPLTAGSSYLNKRLRSLAEVTAAMKPKCDLCHGDGYLPIYNYLPWAEARVEPCYQCGGWGS